MKIHLVNPSDTAFGTAVITPRWLFVLATATPREFGDPILCDETIEQLDAETIEAGDVVGIGIHTGNALRGYALGRLVKERGAFVVFGGIHSTLYPDEAFERGAADCVVRGDGDLAWGEAIRDYVKGSARRVYEGGRVEADQFKPARWDLLNQSHYMWASVQTVRGCSKHCSFCSVWRTDGQRPRQRPSDPVIEEIVELRRRGFRFIALADDNFYPVSLTDITLAERQKNEARVEQLKAIRAERFEFMERLSELPRDMVFFTQITMEAAEDPEFLDAMRKGRIKGALVGVEAVTPEGLKAVFKDFNLIRREPRRTFAPVSRTWRSCTRIVHFRLAHRSPRHVPGYGAARSALRADVCSIRDAYAVLRHRRFRTLGEVIGREPAGDRRRAHHSLLVDPAREKAEDVHAASDNEFAGDAGKNSGCLGQLLHDVRGVEAVAMCDDPASPTGIRIHLEVVSPNVCDDRHRNGQRATRKGERVGEAHREVHPQTVSSRADA